MSRDPRKDSAYSSGLRGSEKKSKASGNGSSKQGPNSKVGDPDGEAFSSGMRGSEKPKQKPALDSSTQAPAGNGGENKQGPNSVVGHPKGEGSTLAGQGAGVQDSALQSHTADAHDMDDNSMERSAAGMAPEAMEDDTHINIRVPKSSIKRGAHRS